MLKQSLIAAVFLLASAWATPTGNHTCTGVVKHEVTVRVNVTEPVTFRAYEWCLRVPPRCSTYTIQLKDRVKIHKEMHNRTITVCCKGYVEIDYKCVPACPPETECPNMHCNRTNHCYCTPGYTGLYCNHACPKGVWGAGCIKPCDCPPGYTCHHLTGDCMIDDSPPPKTRRTTTAEYFTEAGTTLDTAHPTTRTPMTTQTTQPTAMRTKPTTTIPTTTTITTTLSTERPTTTPPPPPTTTTTTTERPTTTVTTEGILKKTTTTTTERPTTTMTSEKPTATELVTQPPPTTLPTITKEKPTTSTSMPVPTVRSTFEATSTSTTTEALTTHNETDTTQKMTPPVVHTHTTENAGGTTTTNTMSPVKTTTQETKAEMSPTTSPTTSPTPASTLTSSTTVTSTTVEEKISEARNPTSTKTTTTTTQALTSEQTTLTTEPTTSPTPNTDLTTLTTQATVEPTLTTTHYPTTTTTQTLPTTSTTETLASTVQKEIQTEPTMFIVPPIKYDLAAITAQTPELITKKTTETTHPLTTVPQTTTTTEPMTQPKTTVTTTTTTEQQNLAETIISTTVTEGLKTVPPTEEVLKKLATPPPQLEVEKLDPWGKIQLGSETKSKERELLQSVVKIGLPKQQLILTPKPEGENEKSGRQNILEKPGVDGDEKRLESVAEVLTSTTDRLDRMIIEDVPNPIPPKPTPDDSPIKLVEEVISKYFPDTFMNPNKAHSNDKENTLGKGKIEVTEKPITQWKTDATEMTNIRSKTVETTEALGTQEETKSHPRTDMTTTTVPPSTTPDISTIAIITPKVIVSAKNPDEIDLGGVIYRKMKFFPQAKQPEESNSEATSPPTTSAILRTSTTIREPTTPIGDRFKIYLPEYEKSSEKGDSEIIEAPTVKTFLPKFNFDKEDFDYGKQSQPKKAKQKDKEAKKYKTKPNEATVPPTSVEEVQNERVTNNVFLETKEFKVHLATTKAAKFGDGYYTKSDQESTDFGKLQRKKAKYGSPEYEPSKFIKYTVPPEGQDFEEGTKEGNFPTTNAKPPHTWYSHVREKAKILNAFKVMKSTIGLDINAKPTEESALEESNDIHSMATQFTEREPRSAAVTYQEDLNNPQMFGQVKFNAPEGYLSSTADDGAKSGIYASVAVGGGCFVAMATLVAVLWLRLKGRTRVRQRSVSFEDGDVRNPARIVQPGRALSTIGDYETVYPIASESDQMEVATFFCPTFTNNYAERINREFREMSYDHPRLSIAEPLYAEILHPKIKDVADQSQQQ